MRRLRCRKSTGRRASAGVLRVTGIDDGELFADAKEEAAVSQVPEVLAMVMEAPLGLSDDFAGGDLEEVGADDAVGIVGRVVGIALHEAAEVEGDEQVCRVGVVDGDHGAAGGEELGQHGLVADGVEGDVNGRNGVACRNRGGPSYCEQQEDASGAGDPAGGREEELHGGTWWGGGGSGRVEDAGSWGREAHVLLYCVTV